MNIAKIARRIGLGNTKELSKYNDISEAIEASLNLPIKFKGIPAIGGQLEDWPSEQEYDLDERIQRLVKRRANEDSIDKQKLSDAERDKSRRENWRKYSVDEIDKYRFFHAGQYADNQIKLRLSYFWLNHFTVERKKQPHS